MKLIYIILSYILIISTSHTQELSKPDFKNKNLFNLNKVSKNGCMSAEPIGNLVDLYNLKLTKEEKAKRYYSDNSHLIYINATKRISFILSKGGPKDSRAPIYKKKLEQLVDEYIELAKLNAFIKRKCYSYKGGNCKLNEPSRQQYVYLASIGYLIDVSRQYKIDQIKINQLVEYGNKLFQANKKLKDNTSSKDIANDRQAMKAYTYGVWSIVTDNEEAFKLSYKYFKNALIGFGENGAWKCRWCKKAWERKERLRYGMTAVGPLALYASIMSPEFDFYTKKHGKSKATVQETVNWILINSLNQPDAKEKLLEVRYNEFEYDRMFATLSKNFKKYKEKQNIKWMWSENSTGDRNMSWLYPVKQVFSENFPEIIETYYFKRPKDPIIPGGDYNIIGSCYWG